MTPPLGFRSGVAWGLIIPVQSESNRPVRVRELWAGCQCWSCLVHFHYSYIISQANDVSAMSSMAALTECEGVWTVLDSVGQLDLLLFGEDTCALQKVTSGNYDCAFWLISLMTACSVFINFQGIKKVAGSKMKSRCRWPDICFCYKQNQVAVLGFVLVVVKQCKLHYKEKGYQMIKPNIFQTTQNNVIPVIY